MQINDTINAVAFGLQLYPMPDRAQVISDVNFPTGLNAGKNTFFLFLHNVFTPF
jgi:hypothetical protein